ncbi:uncharacterized protein [Euphorbia lathyris]|uniref:uncharacterized protein isoform X2 n=1 Tax=Euphorbia lathyris TaxID=212925 RepID=UPI0033136021
MFGYYALLFFNVQVLICEALEKLKGSLSSSKAPYLVYHRMADLLWRLHSNTEIFKIAGRYGIERGLSPRKGWCSREESRWLLNAFSALIEASNHNNRCFPNQHRRLLLQPSRQFIQNSQKHSDIRPGNILVIG